MVSVKHRILGSQGVVGGVLEDSQSRIKTIGPPYGPLRNLQSLYTHYIQYSKQGPTL